MRPLEPYELRALRVGEKVCLTDHCRIEEVIAQCARATGQGYRIETRRVEISNNILYAMIGVRRDCVDHCGVLICGWHRQNPVMHSPEELLGTAEAKEMFVRLDRIRTAQIEKKAERVWHAVYQAISLLLFVGLGFLMYSMRDVIAPESYGGLLLLAPIWMGLAILGAVLAPKTARLWTKFAPPKDESLWSIRHMSEKYA